MKIRQGFVSNSSSSSFILFKAYMTKDQIEEVRDWYTYALTKDYFVKVQDYLKKTRPEEQIPEFFKRDPIEVKEDDFEWDPSGWKVEETNQTFDIGTDMDNYDFEFFLKVIGVDIDKVGIRTLDHYSYVLGLNDARTDLRDYASDPYYYEHYDSDYWLTSDLYKNDIYPKEVKFAKDYDMAAPLEPKDKMVWICEDAGQALNEVEHKVKDLAYKNGVYYLKTMSNGEYFDDKTRIYSEVLEVINEVKDNWKARDDFEEPQVYTAPLDLERWNKKEEDDSQRVIAALEGQGYFSPEDEKKYNESVDKLYKPLGVNIFDEVKPEDC